MIRALRQVVSTPRIKYMHFDGDPMNYVSFFHNFRTCLEKVVPDPKVMDKNSSQNESRLTAVTGAGERVCLSVIPVKVQIKGQNTPAVICTFGL